jgi:hypothetical protein
MARWLGGAAIMAIVVGRLGTGPFLQGLRGVDARALAIAAGIGGVTTVCAAWRWHLVARGLEVAVPLRAATAEHLAGAAAAPCCVASQGDQQPSSRERPR